jgi:rfaE bifunctional protein nucleotidyltransferase chain/domain
VEKSKTVLVGGVFDLLHFGHISFLKKAKALGDFLIVALESDKNVKKIKGVGRPFHNQKQRKEMLESLRFVDKVIVLKDKMTNEDYNHLVFLINPSIIAVTKGDPILKRKQIQAKKIGAKVIEIAKVKTHSTSTIANVLKVE